MLTNEIKIEALWESDEVADFDVETVGTISGTLVWRGRFLDGTLAGRTVVVAPSRAHEMMRRQVLGMPTVSEFPVNRVIRLED